MALSPQATVSIAATSASASQPLAVPSPGMVLVTNAGPDLAFVKLATSAAVTDTPVLANQTLELEAGGATEVAAICGGTGTATVYFTASNRRQGF